MKIVELSENPKLLKEAIRYFWESWGNENNFRFYQDCIENLLNDKNRLPKFYIGLEKEEIVASYALLVNDLISRQDLYPWLACLHVKAFKRNKGYGAQLLNHGLQESRRLGFEEVYLSTDLLGFYEKKEWNLFGKAYSFSGEEFKIYSKSTETIKGST